ncbi:MAG TPA: PsiF family protein [Roseococcus sp.]|jgi:hypothetical protein|nr:PsiF family protein [Roseococcus sp.]
MIRLALAAILLLAVHGMAEAREPTPAQHAQQQKMRACNADARTRELRGDPRKAFMRECLRRSAAAPVGRPG